MKVLVTGGSGFLGAWVMRRLLARGIDVRAFDVRRDDRLLNAISGTNAGRAEWSTGDIASASDVSDAMRGCSDVIHLAGVLTPSCSAHPVRGAQVNLIGTLNVFEAARAFSDLTTAFSLVQRRTMVRSSWHVKAQRVLIGTMRACRA